MISNNKRSRQVFTEIAPDKFHWQNESTMKDGTVKVWCEAFATRMQMLLTYSKEAGDAEADLDRFIKYFIFEKESMQAAENVAEI